jgi:hypothetical protein
MIPLVIGVALGALLTIAGVGLWFTILGPDRLCHGCPAGVPLAAVLAVGEAVPACSSLQNATDAVCNYTFPLSLPEGSRSWAAVASGSDLSFILEDASDLSEDAKVTSISLVDRSGCGIGEWNATDGRWGATGFPLPCVPPRLSDPIQSGDSLVLVPSPPDTLSLSHRGYHLIAFGSSGSVNGQVGAWIP